MSYHSQSITASKVRCSGGSENSTLSRKVLMHPATVLCDSTNTASTTGMHSLMGKNCRY